MEQKNKNISIKEMLELSQKLYEGHGHEWERLPGREFGSESNIYWIAWLVGEIGEMIDIIKKKGAKKIMKDFKIRKDMVEEIVDCYMFLADILNRYKISSTEFSEAYFKKMDINLKRDYSNTTHTEKKKLGL